MSKIPLNGKNVDLSQLQAEMIAAGIQITALGIVGGQLVTYDNQGNAIDLPPAATAVLAAHTISTALRDQLVSVLTQTVGVSLTSLTQAQRLSLVVGLLYKANAIDHITLQVKPLNTWLVP